MNTRGLFPIRCGAMLALCLAVLLCTGTASAQDGRQVLAADELQQRPVLPPIRVGGIRGGKFILITERGAQTIKPELVAQRQLSKPATLIDFCLIR